MVTAENTPVREIPGLTGEGLKRTKARLRKLGRKASEATGLTKLFGTPENPTKLGRVMDFVGSVAESAPATGKFAVGRQPRYNVRRILTGKNADPLYAIHSMSMDSLEKIARGEKLMLNPSTAINKIGKFGWRSFLGGDGRIGDTGGGSVSVLMPIPKTGIQTAADGYTSIVSDMSPEVLRSPSLRAAHYKREAEKVINHPRVLLGGDYVSITDRIRHPEAKYGLPISGAVMMEPGKRFPKVVSEWPQSTAKTLTDFEEAFKVVFPEGPAREKAQIEALRLASSEGSFRKRLAGYRAAFGKDIDPLVYKDMVTATENLRNQRINEELLKGLSEDVVENKPGTDIPIAGRTVIVEPGVDESRLNAVMKALPDTTFIRATSRPGGTVGDIIRGKAEVFQAAKGGNARGESKSSGVPSGHNPALDGYGGPRIVINPSTFKNGKDALCVAFDEAFRVIMEMNGFDPQSEPTEKQRKFFSDTAYANDETMLRRTILARICTFDTSVSDPTDEQLQEAVEFLDTVMEIGAPQNEWEQRSVQRIRDAIAKTVGQPRTSGKTPEPPAEGPSNAAAGGGKTDEDKPNGTFDTKEAVDYRDNDGSWRTSTGQLIGDDSQKKQYDQAKEALKGSGAYYDNGVFRTQEGFKIGGNLESVQKWAAQAAEASKTDGSYFDGKWRDPTGKAMNFSGNDGSTFSAGGGASGQSNMDGRTLGEDGFLRDSATGKLDMFGAQTTKGTTVSGQGYAAQPGDAVAQGKSRLTSGEQAWQERKRQSTEAWAKRTGQTDSAGYENDAPPAPDAGVENGSEASGAKREARRIGSGDVHQMNGPSKTGRRLGEVDIHRMH